MTDIVSHRGGALLWPENSRIAFEATAKLPVEQVEFDVHPSRDGRLVVFHDETLERTTDGTGPVSAREWSELATLILKGTGGQRMLLLEEVIEIFRMTEIALRLEIKPGPGRVPYPDLPGRIVATLAREGMLARTVITSFQIETVVEARLHGVPMRHVWLATPAMQVDLGLAGVIEAARRHEVPMLGLRHTMLDVSTVAAVRAAGLGVGGWGCNDASAISHALELGLDAFTTDRPDLALELRARRMGGRAG
ncbi:MAG: glycerophosphodiester phosphodiesterase [Proteobacteria bacterium]|nr:glycerophosphodiester phosphodiesterase [Pseudomonadota bacterium]